MSEYSHVFLVEEGSVKGGIGEYISSLLSYNHSDVLFRNIGIPEEFLSQALRSELLTYCGLDGPGIANSVSKFVGTDSIRQEEPIPLRMV